MKVCFIAQRMMRYELKEGGKCGLNDAVKVPTYRVAGCVEGLNLFFFFMFW